jgi:hypothetical protein
VLITDLIDLVISDLLRTAKCRTLLFTVNLIFPWIPTWFTNYLTPKLQGSLGHRFIQRAKVRGQRQHAARDVLAQAVRLGEALRPHLRSAEGCASKRVPNFYRTFQ